MCAKNVKNQTLEIIDTYVICLVCNDFVSVAVVLKKRSVNVNHQTSHPVLLIQMPLSIDKQNSLTIGVDMLKNLGA